MALICAVLGRDEDAVGPATFSTTDRGHRSARHLQVDVESLPLSRIPKATSQPHRPYMALDRTLRILFMTRGTLGFEPPVLWHSPIQPCPPGDVVVRVFLQLVLVFSSDAVPSVELRCARSMDAAAGVDPPDACISDKRVYRHWAQNPPVPFADRSVRSARESQTRQKEKPGSVEMRLPGLRLSAGYYRRSLSSPRRGRTQKRLVIAQNLHRVP